MKNQFEVLSRANVHAFTSALSSPINQNPNGETHRPPVDAISQSPHSSLRKSPLRDSSFQRSRTSMIMIILLSNNPLL